MRRALLIGKDPLFAWALERRISQCSTHLEHVYTIGEAQLRLKRFHYDVVLFDGLSPLEISSVRESIPPKVTLILISDGASQELTDCDNILSMAKEKALEKITSTFLTN